MGIAKVQHYIPQFLLRNFGNGKKDQLWVYDKAKDRSFATNAKNIASESRFYNFEFEGDAVTLEPMLSRLEATAKPVIDRILDNDSLAHIQPADKAALSVFFAVQLTRTRAFREQWTYLPTMLRDHLLSRGETPESLLQVADFLREPTENETKAETARFMVRAPQELAPHFANKTWVLAATTRKQPFLISDNPLALQNMIDMSPRGNLGVAVTGIEIYLPLSPVRALAMWCPSLEATVREGAASLRRLERLAPNIATDQLRDPEGLIALEAAIETGRPVRYNKENVGNFNSLQVARSERYVFSSMDDFHLARDMIGSHPSLRRGPRMQAA